MLQKDSLFRRNDSFFRSPTPMPPAPAANPAPAPSAPAHAEAAKPAVAKDDERCGCARSGAASATC